MPWNSSMLFRIATILVVFVASLEQLLKIPDVNVFSGQGFEVKLNFTDKVDLPEEVSFVKLDKTSGGHKISIFFLHYHKDEGSMSGSVQDSRTSFIGNLSSGHVWFRFLDVRVNDSGTYGVLYKRPQNTDIFESVFEVNVTRAPPNNAINPKFNNGETHIHPSERPVINRVTESATVSALTSRDTGVLVLFVVVVAKTII